MSQLTAGLQVRYAWLKAGIIGNLRAFKPILRAWLRGVTRTEYVAQSESGLGSSVRLFYSYEAEVGGMKSTKP